MNHFTIDNKKKNSISQEKILLVLLPYWPPLIPPLGISCLKSYLRQHGFEVKTADANTDSRFKQVYDKYFNTLQEYVPDDKQGNLYNIGHDVLKSHMMAHLDYEKETDYLELVKQVIAKNYFFTAAENLVKELNKIVNEFYTILAGYFLDLLQENQPTVLGLSVYRGVLPASLFAFKLTRPRYPHIRTVMGGAIFSQSLGIGTPNWQRFLEKTPYIDKIIIGEGEKLFLKYLQGELPESRRVYTLKDINDEVLDISGLEVPDFTDLDLHYYPNLASYASRSCPFQCSFCSETVYWGKYRKKSAHQVADELHRLYKTYGSQLFLLGDSLLNPVITDLARAFIERETAIYWDGYLRVDQEACRDEIVLLWRQGGFYRARLGIESGSPRILAAMGKKVTVDQCKTTISTLARMGIKTTTYWVVGYPGETSEDFRQTLEMIEELKNDIYEAECNHFRYFLTGQVSSGEWSQEKILPLYTGNVENMLMIQTWIMDCEPSREEQMKRVNRFVQHCHRLGIPNPYHLHDIHQADERWKKLHKNAVPPVMEFEINGEYIDECKRVKNLHQAQSSLQNDVNFCF